MSVPAQHHTAIRVPKIIRVILVGFGNVGRDLATLFLDRSDDLLDRNGVHFMVTAIVTGRHGSIINERGVDLEWALRKARYGDEPSPGAPVIVRADSGVTRFGPACDPNEVIRNVPADVVIELSPLNIDSGEPAISHIEAALRAGRHVVTANKGPIAFAFERLSNLARECNRRLLFESTVMDGTPIFNMARYSLRGARVLGFKGILNSTTNFILEHMEKGGDLNEAVAEAQRLGFAEADPSMDLEGWDAAAKTTVLSNVLLGANITPRDVDRTGIMGITPQQVHAALKAGERIKLVCESAVAGASRAPGALRPCVAPQRFPIEHPFAQVSGTSSVLTLTTDLMGDITITENDPELMQTAYGVLNDLLEVAEEL